MKQPLLFGLIAGINCSAWADVGSRATCDPAPTDTDRDVIVLCVSGEAHDLADKIYRQGGELCGAEYGEFEDDYGILPVRLGDDNYLITESAEYFYRFVAVTEFAKRVNLMDKADRKALFAAAMDSERASPGEGRITVNVAPVEGSPF